MPDSDQTTVPDEFANRFLPTRRTLLSRLRNLGDQDSWQEFFDAYWKLIYRAARKAGLSDPEAQDVVQETLLTITRRIQTFRYDPALGSFKGWLLHTTRWRVLDHIRRRERHGTHLAEADAPTDGEALDQIPDPASAQVDAFWEAEWQENLVAAAMQRIKRQINPVHYQAFELYVLKRWPAMKVARSLAINLAQVHIIKHRVGKMLRKEVLQLEAHGI